MTTPTTRNYAAFAAAALLLIGLGAIALVGRAGPARAAAQQPPAFSALSGPSDASLASDRVLGRLRTDDPDLVIDQARLLVNDKQGKLWLVPSQSGQVCVVSKPSGVPGLQGQFACKDPDVLRREPLVSGSPGSWYGVAPDGVATVTATVDGRAQTIATKNNAFRLPAAASAVDVDGTAVFLPALPQQ